MFNEEVTNYGLKISDSNKQAVHSASRMVRNALQEGQPRAEIDLKRKAHLQELSLAQGRVLHQIFSILTEDPFISEEDLVQKVKDDVDVVTPELTEALLTTVLQLREGVLAVRAYLLEKGGDEKAKKEFASFLFQSLVNEYYKKKSGFSSEKIDDLLNASVEIKLTAFGIVLNVKDSDAYLLIHHDSRGYFEHSVSINIHDGELTPEATFPLMVVNGMSFITEAHEIGHAFNKIIVKTLLGNTKSEQSSKNIHAVWGRFSTWEEARAIAESLMRTVGNPEAIYSGIINQMMLKAKDEILAEMLKGRYADLPSKLGVMKSKGDVYDYLKQLHVPMLPEDYDDIWQRYLERLDTYINKAVGFFSYYQDREQDSIWGKRIKPFIGFLQTTPIDSWQSQIERFGYEEERQLSKEITEMVNAFENRILSADFNIFEQSHFVKNLFQRYFSQKFYHKHEYKKILLIIDQSDHSCIAELCSIKESLKQETKLFEETEYATLFQLIKEIRAVDNQGMELMREFNGVSIGFYYNFATEREKYKAKIELESMPDFIPLEDRESYLSVLIDAARSRLDKSIQFNQICEGAIEKIHELREVAEQLEPGWNTDTGYLEHAGVNSISQVMELFDSYISQATSTSGGDPDRLFSGVSRSSL